MRRSKKRKKKKSILCQRSKQFCPIDKYFVNYHFINEIIRIQNVLLYLLKEKKKRKKKYFV
ncbi:hypothetical protein PFTANZ_01755 [Plasmodium falciparum Tanzania (2000708)]|uniref:Uncharacterized protein n=2 Tax=Plasmodium falciparum TaxID=5833 RepID=A0A024W9K4_PLAFA|nr:hypothetical protein PFTANZ_01755 [Plasmodium falciparum Tanzania (2000708)]ETW43865.1 hypothetical protein PFNF135_01799 [Plasmodium falciparum NF135/5.C10]